MLMNEYSEMIEKALDEFLIKDNDVKGLVDSMEYGWWKKNPP